MTLTVASRTTRRPSRPRVVLIHGAATTARVWRELAATLTAGRDIEVVAPMRRSSGSWKSELDELAELCTGAFVVGVSGGATLGVGLLERDIPVLGAVLHEPAAGTLAPNLLDAVVAAMATGGPAAFGPALYGPSWSPELLSDDPDAVARDLAMFRGFEPKPAAEALPHVVITVGERSPAIRHQSVAAVAAVIRARTAVVPGASHAVHLDSVDNFVELIVTELDTADARPRTVGAARAHLRKEGN